MADMKNDPASSTPNTPVGGSTHAKEGDSKISAGSSLGTPGTPPKPAGMTGSTAGAPAMGSTPGAAAGTPGGAGAGSSGGMGASNLGASNLGASNQGSSGSAQSSTLASHTSHALGGNAGPTGAGRQAGSEYARHQDHSAQDRNTQGRGGHGGGQGASDQAREAADQIRQQASDMYESAADWARDKYEQASSYASRSGGGRSSSFGGVQRFANENPVLVGVVGLAAGLLLGALLPRTRQEDRTFGEWSDEVREQGLRYAQEMTGRAREYAEGAFSGDDPRFAHHESEYRGSGSGSRDDAASEGARRFSPIAGQEPPRNH